MVAKKETFRIDMLKQEIESEKTALDRYIKTIVEYGFTNVCNAAVYFQDLYYKELLSANGAIEGSKLTKEQKDKLSTSLMFISGPNPTKIELLESNLKYYQRLNSWAEHKLNSLPYEIRKEIIKKSIEHCCNWSDQFDRTSKISRDIEEIEKENKKVKKKPKVKKK